MSDVPISPHRAPARGDEPALSLYGISYRTAPIDVLERVALSPEEVKAVIERLRINAGLSDAMVLSTCNRTEVYTASPRPADEVWSTVAGVLNDVAGPHRLPPEEHLYRFRGRDSMQHLFRVACGLDSMILGEAQILGQIREAFERSRGVQAPDPYFEHVVQSAFKVARRSRTDTDIAKGAVSVASAAVHLATRFYSDLSSHTIVVVGAGDTGRLLSEHFSKHAPKRLVIVNRTAERAALLAREVGGEARPWDALAELLVEADIVASAVQVTAPVLTKDLVATSLAKRDNRPLVLLDLGLPRNVAADCEAVGNVFVNDLEALQRVVDGNLARRRKEVSRVEQLIHTEIDKLLEHQRGLQAGPLIAALRESVEQVRRAEVARATAKLSEAERESVDRVTRAVVNKLLHGPTTSIKAIAQQQEHDADQLELIRSLFSNLDLGKSDRDP